MLKEAPAWLLRLHSARTILPLLAVGPGTLNSETTLPPQLPPIFWSQIFPLIQVPLGNLSSSVFLTIQQDFSSPSLHIAIQEHVM